jgi:FAD dependent oxidoreductase
MLALRGDAEAHRAMIALETPVLAGRIVRREIETDGAAPTRIATEVVVNAAGLSAQAVARSIVSMPADKAPPLHFTKRYYFSLRGRSPFSRPIHPMPTCVAGSACILRSISPARPIDYNVDPRRADSFYVAIRKLDLPDGALQPAHAGIRPKFDRPGGSTTDFLIQTEKDHGVQADQSVRH